MAKLQLKHEHEQQKRSDLSDLEHSRQANQRNLSNKILSKSISVENFLANRSLEHDQLKQMWAEEEQSKWMGVAEARKRDRHKR